MMIIGAMSIIEPVKKMVRMSLIVSLVRGTDRKSSAVEQKALNG